MKPVGRRSGIPKRLTDQPKYGRYERSPKARIETELEIDLGWARYHLALKDLRELASALYTLGQDEAAGAVLKAQSQYQDDWENLHHDDRLRLWAADKLRRQGTHVSPFDIRTVNFSVEVCSYGTCDFDVATVVMLYGDEYPLDDTSWLDALDGIAKYEDYKRTRW